jgi:CheY-like chemotaxis protein
MATNKVLLVIDDDPVVVRSLHRFVRDSLPDGWEVWEETDPLQGLVRATSHRVEIVFVDLVMPTMKGEELVARLLVDRPEMRGSIVVCSGMPLNQAEEHHLFFELGCRELRKPFTLEQLDQLLWELIEEQE